FTPPPTIPLIEAASSGNDGVSQMAWPALSPDLNPIENLWDQLSHRVEGRNPALQILNDLRAALQEEWDAMPQQTTSRLVNSMRHRCQAVIDTCLIPSPYLTVDTELNYNTLNCA
uniref:Tc1-like transposase DDE domain-containing protein n=1 Tax=Sinocyclocheilus grahami TaxID=75366 RepID=A0A672KJN1_SINGR